jgi:hypothetical protein
MDALTTGPAAPVVVPVVVPAAAGQMAVVLTTASNAWHVPIVAWSIAGSVATPILAVPVRVPCVVYVAVGNGYVNAATGMWCDSLASAQADAAKTLPRP